VGFAASQLLAIKALCPAAVRDRASSKFEEGLAKELVTAAATADLAALATAIVYFPRKNGHVILGFL
jgi:hypothetical protein